MSLDIILIIACWINIVFTILFFGIFGGSMKGYLVFTKHSIYDEFSSSVVEIINNDDNVFTDVNQAEMRAKELTDEKTTTFIKEVHIVES